MGRKVRKGKGSTFQDGPLPSPALVGPLVRRGCVSASSHLQGSLSGAWGPLCVGGMEPHRASLVIICLWPPIGCSEKGAFQGPGHRSLCHNLLQHEVTSARGKFPE